MSSNVVFKLFFLLGVLLIVGCRAAVPVYNVSSAPVTTNKPASIDEIEKAIIRAGVGLGWQMVSRGKGKVEGTLVLREHRAVVDIDYDAKNFNIKYKDSTKLDYDGEKIHPNYNSWVQNLDRAIRAQLTAM